MVDKLQIKMPVLGAIIEIIVTDDIEKAKKAIPKSLHSMIGHWDRCGFCLPCVSPLPRFPHGVFIYADRHDISIIVHEAVHAAVFVLDAMGEVVKAGHQELCAYITEYILEEYLKKYWDVE